jgi:periplasmic protein TonB
MNRLLLCALSFVAVTTSADAADETVASTPKQMGFQLVDFAKPIKRATPPVTKEDKARAREQPCPPPDYPYGARMRKEEGRTRISVLIEPDGFVSNIKVIESSGSAELDEASSSTIGGCWFPPAKHGLSEWMETSYDWKL